jgi:tape measure domain-containing protein
MAVMGFQALGQMAMQTASSLLQPAMTAETTQLSFETLLHSTSAAKDMMQSLNTFASGTPMQTQWIDDAAAKMLAFGFKTTSVIPDITAIGDSLSGLGKLSSASLGSIVDIFGKVQAAGKLTGGDMMQLSNWGIPAWQALADSMHKPIPELQKMVSSGLIPAAQALPALQQGMESVFGGGMAKQANTMTGIISTLQSNFQIAMAALGSPLIKVAEQGLGHISDILASKSFQDFATQMGTNVGNAFTSLLPMLSNFGAEASKVFGILNDEGLGVLIGSFQTLGSAVGNLISPFGLVGQLLASIFTNGNIESGALSLEGSFYDIAAAIDLLSAGIQSVTNFFKENSIQAQIVEDLMIGIGVAIATIQIGAFVATIPALVAGFIAWAGAATAAAIATIIAAAPIVLIGLAIALVVAGIILAVQHWGDISKWLVGAWSNVSGFFAGMWATIQGFFGGMGQWFQDRFTDASNGVKSGFQGAQSFFGGLGQWFNAKGAEAGQGAKTGLQSVTDSYMAMAHSAADSMIWLYNHNYYVKATVDAITKWTGDAGAWLQSTWSSITGWISSEWQALGAAATLYWGQMTTFISQKLQEAQAFITSIWNAVTGWLGAKWAVISLAATLYWTAISAIISQKLQEAQAFIMSIWTAAAGWIGAQWNLLAGMANAAWVRVSGVFASIWTTYISGPLGSLWNQIVGWFGNLSNQAYSSGTNFINMLVSGIQSGAGSIWNAVLGIANQIWKALGFHSPAKAGPGADADTWMPNLVNMLSSSLIAQQPKMSLAVQTIAQPLAMMNAGSYPAQSGGSSVPLQGGSSAGSTATGDQHFHIYIGNEEFAHMVGNAQMRNTRLRTGMRI